MAFPDDAFLVETGGVRQGVKDVQQALGKHGVNTNAIYTSKDANVAAALADLSQARQLPNGFTQRWVPVVLNKRILVFSTDGPPGATIPNHKHEADLFRVITSGTAIYNGIQLSAGDWMFVPAGEAYSLTGSNNPGYTSYHMYG